jgi:hypothetical protein
VRLFFALDNANWIEYLATRHIPTTCRGRMAPSAAPPPRSSPGCWQRRPRRRVTVPAGTTALGSGPTTAITIGLTKWSEMAIDSGNFRNWAGIHFVDVNRHGVKVGHNALDKASSYWS